jgi:hypothetical protein
MYTVNTVPDGSFIFVLQLKLLIKGVGAYKEIILMIFFLFQGELFGDGEPVGYLRPGAQCEDVRSCCHFTVHTILFALSYLVVVNVAITVPYVVVVTAIVNITDNQWENFFIPIVRLGMLFSSYWADCTAHSLTVRQPWYSLGRMKESLPS